MTPLLRIGLLYLITAALVAPIFAGQPMRYLRFDGYASSDNGQINLMEIEPIGPNGVNPARYFMEPSTVFNTNPRLETITLLEYEAEITTNSGDAELVKLLIDGNTDRLGEDRFSTNRTTPGLPSEAAPHRIEIEFGRTVWIEQILVHHHGESTASYGLFGSMDGENWTPLETFSDTGLTSTTDVPSIALSGLDLSNVDLRGVDLSNTDLSGTQFTNARLTGVRSGGVTGDPDFGDPDFGDPDFSFGWRLTNGYIVGPGVDLSGADLTGIDLSSDMLLGVESGNVVGVPDLPENYQMLSGYILGPEVYLDGVDLSGLDLDMVDLTGATLTGVKSGGIVGSPTLPDGYEVVGSGYIAGAGVNLSGADLRLEYLNDMDLTGSDFSGADLTSANLTDTSLIDADLRNAILAGADMGDADLSNADLTGANLDRAQLSNRSVLDGVKSGGIQGDPMTLPEGYSVMAGYLIGPSVDLSGRDLSGLTLSGANLTEANLKGANFSGSDLSDAILIGANLSAANLRNSDLSGVNLGSVDMSELDLTGVKSGDTQGSPSLPDGYFLVSGYIIGPAVDLSGKILSGVELGGKDLKGANLSGSDLTGANLRGADLKGANLQNANLDRADLRGSRLEEASLTDASMTDSTVRWPSVVAAEDMIDELTETVGSQDAQISEQATQIEELSARPTLAEVIDARPGAVLLEADTTGGEVHVELSIEESDDLNDWTPRTEKAAVTLQLEADKKFYRFSLE